MTENNSTMTNGTNYSFLFKLLTVSAAIALAAAATITLMVKAAATTSLVASSVNPVAILFFAAVIIALVALAICLPHNRMNDDKSYYDYNDGCSYFSGDSQATVSDNGHGHSSDVGITHYHS